MRTLPDLLNQRNLSALFQPVAELSNGRIIGYEGLIRGPSDSPLHLPVKLFAAARQQALTLETEMVSRQIVLESFAAQKLPGNLFLNVSPDTLIHPSFKNVQTPAYLEYLGIDPKRVIIEITESQPVCDFETMRNAMLHFRGMGFRIAIDDLGEGFSNLRLWSELRPEYIKVDMHFVRGINADPLKQQFLKSIQNIAQSSGTQVIAEGVETEVELAFVRDIGIAFAQGNFIARPSPVPPLNAAVKVATPSTIHHTNEQSHCGNVTAEKILRYVEPVYPETEIEKLFGYFSRNRNVRVIPVVRHRRPIGLIHRYEFVDSFAVSMRRERLGRRVCGDVMNTKPLLVEKSMPLDELSRLLSESDIRHFADGFVITAQGHYHGIGSGQDLLREVAGVRSNDARQAGQFRQPPGKTPADAYISCLPHGMKSFAACHASGPEKPGSGRLGVRSESSGFNQHEMADVYY